MPTTAGATAAADTETQLHVLQAKVDQWTRNIERAIIPRAGGAAERTHTITSVALTEERTLTAAERTHTTQASERSAVARKPPTPPQAGAAAAGGIPPPAERDADALPQSSRSLRGSPATPVSPALKISRSRLDMVANYEFIDNDVTSIGSESHLADSSMLLRQRLNATRDSVRSSPAVLAADVVDQLSEPSLLGGTDAGRRAFDAFDTQPLAVDVDAMLLPEAGGGARTGTPGVPRAERFAEQRAIMAEVAALKRGGGPRARMDHGADGAVRSRSPPRGWRERVADASPGGAEDVEATPWQRRQQQQQQERDRRAAARAGVPFFAGVSPSPSPMRGGPSGGGGGSRSPGRGASSHSTAKSEEHLLLQEEIVALRREVMHGKYRALQGAGTQLSGDTINNTAAMRRLALAVASAPQLAETLAEERIKRRQESRRQEAEREQQHRADMEKRIALKGVGSGVIPAGAAASGDTAPTPSQSVSDLRRARRETFTKKRLQKLLEVSNARARRASIVNPAGPAGGGAAANAGAPGGPGARSAGNNSTTNAATDAGGPAAAAPAAVLEGQGGDAGTQKKPRDDARPPVLDTAGVKADGSVPAVPQSGSPDGSDGRGSGDDGDAKKNDVPAASGAGMVVDPACEAGAIALHISAAAPQLPAITTRRVQTPDAENGNSPTHSPSVGSAGTGCVSPLQKTAGSSSWPTLRQSSFGRAGNELPAPIVPLPPSSSSVARDDDEDTKVLLETEGMVISVCSNAQGPPTPSSTTPPVFSVQSALQKHAAELREAASGGSVSSPRRSSRDRPPSVPSSVPTSPDRSAAAAAALGLRLVNNDEWTATSDRSLSSSEDQGPRQNTQPLTDPGDGKAAPADKSGSASGDAQDTPSSPRSCASTPRAARDTQQSIRSALDTPRETFCGMAPPRPPPLGIDAIVADNASQAGGGAPNVVSPVDSIGVSSASKPVRSPMRRVSHTSHNSDVDSCLADYCTTQRLIEEEGLPVDDQVEGFQQSLNAVSALRKTVKQVKMQVAVVGQMEREVERAAEEKRQEFLERQKESPWTQPQTTPQEVGPSEELTLPASPTSQLPRRADDDEFSDLEDIGDAAARERARLAHEERRQHEIADARERAREARTLAKQQRKAQLELQYEQAAGAAAAGGGERTSASTQPTAAATAAPPAVSSGGAALPCRGRPGDGVSSSSSRSPSPPRRAAPHDEDDLDALHGVELEEARRRRPIDKDAVYAFRCIMEEEADVRIAVQLTAYNAEIQYAHPPGGDGEHESEESPGGNPISAGAMKSGRVYPPLAPQRRTSGDARLSPMSSPTRALCSPVDALNATSTTFVASPLNRGQQQQQQPQQQGEQLMPAAMEAQALPPMRHRGYARSAFAAKDPPGAVQPDGLSGSPRPDTLGAPPEGIASPAMGSTFALSHSTPGGVGDTPHPEPQPTALSLLPKTSHEGAASERLVEHTHGTATATLGISASVGSEPLSFASAAPQRVVDGVNAEAVDGSRRQRAHQPARVVGEDGVGPHHPDRPPTVDDECYDDDDGDHSSGAGAHQARRPAPSPLERPNARRAAQEQQQHHSTTSHDDPTSDILGEDTIPLPQAAAVAPRPVEGHDVYSDPDGASAVDSSYDTLHTESRSTNATPALRGKPAPAPAPPSESPPSAAQPLALPHATSSLLTPSLTPTHGDPTGVAAEAQGTLSMRLTSEVSRTPYQKGVDVPPDAAAKLVSSLPDDFLELTSDEAVHARLHGQMPLAAPARASTAGSSCSGEVSSAASPRRAWRGTGEAPVGERTEGIVATVVRQPKPRGSPPTAAAPAPAGVWDGGSEPEAATAPPPAPTVNPRDQKRERGKVGRKASSQKKGGATRVSRVAAATATASPSPRRAPATATGSRVSQSRAAGASPPPMRFGSPAKVWQQQQQGAPQLHASSSTPSAGARAVAARTASPPPMRFGSPARTPSPAASTRRAKNPGAGSRSGTPTRTPHSVRMRKIDELAQPRSRSSPVVPSISHVRGKTPVRAMVAPSATFRDGSERRKGPREASASPSVASRAAVSREQKARALSAFRKRAGRRDSDGVLNYDDLQARYDAEKARDAMHASESMHQKLEQLSMMKRQSDYRSSSRRKRWDNGGVQHGTPPHHAMSSGSEFSHSAQSHSYSDSRVDDEGYGEAGWTPSETQRPSDFVGALAPESYPWTAHAPSTSPPPPHEMATGTLPPGAVMLNLNIHSPGGVIGHDIRPTAQRGTTTSPLALPNVDTHTLPTNYATCPSQPPAPHPSPHATRLPYPVPQHAPLRVSAAPLDMPHDTSGGVYTDASSPEHERPTPYGSVQPVYGNHAHAHAHVTPKRRPHDRQEEESTGDEHDVLPARPSPTPIRGGHGPIHGYAADAAATAPTGAADEYTEHGGSPTWDSGSMRYPSMHAHEPHGAGGRMSVRDRDEQPPDPRPRVSDTHVDPVVATPVAALAAVSPPSATTHGTQAKSTTKRDASDYKALKQRLDRMEVLEERVREMEAQMASARQERDREREHEREREREHERERERERNQQATAAQASQEDAVPLKQTQPQLPPPPQQQHPQQQPVHIVSARSRLTTASRAPRARAPAGGRASDAGASAQADPDDGFVGAHYVDQDGSGVILSLDAQGLLSLALSIPGDESASASGGEGGPRGTPRGRGRSPIGSVGRASRGSTPPATPPSHSLAAHTISSALHARDPSRSPASRKFGDFVSPQRERELEAGGRDAVSSGGVRPPFETYQRPALTTSRWRPLEDTPEEEAQAALLRQLRGEDLGSAPTTSVSPPRGDHRRRSATSPTPSRDGRDQVQQAPATRRRSTSAVSSALSLPSPRRFHGATLSSALKTREGSPSPSSVGGGVGAYALPGMGRWAARATAAAARRGSSGTPPPFETYQRPALTVASPRYPQVDEPVSVASRSRTPSPMPQVRGAAALRRLMPQGARGGEPTQQSQQQLPATEPPRHGTAPSRTAPPPPEEQAETGKATVPHRGRTTTPKAATRTKSAGGGRGAAAAERLYPGAVGKGGGAGAAVQPAAATPGRRTSTAAERTATPTRGTSERRRAPPQGPRGPTPPLGRGRGDVRSRSSPAGAGAGASGGKGRGHPTSPAPRHTPTAAAERSSGAVATGMGSASLVGTAMSRTSTQGRGKSTAERTRLTAVGRQPAVLPGQKEADNDNDMPMTHAHAHVVQAPQEQGRVALQPPQPADAVYSSAGERNEDGSYDTDDHEGGDADATGVDAAAVQPVPVRRALHEDADMREDRIAPARVRAPQQRGVVSRMSDSDSDSGADVGVMGYAHARVGSVETTRRTATKLPAAAGVASGVAAVPRAGAEGARGGGGGRRRAPARQSSPADAVLPPPHVATPPDPPGFGDVGLVMSPMAGSATPQRPARNAGSLLTLLGVPATSPERPTHSVVDELGGGLPAGYVDRDGVGRKGPKHVGDLFIMEQDCLEFTPSLGMAGEIIAVGGGAPRRQMSESSAGTADDLPMLVSRPYDGLARDVVTPRDVAPLSQRGTPTLTPAGAKVSQVTAPASSPDRSHPSGSLRDIYESSRRSNASSTSRPRSVLICPDCHQDPVANGFCTATGRPHPKQCPFCKRPPSAFAANPYCSASGALHSDIAAGRVPSVPPLTVPAAGRGAGAPASVISSPPQASVDGAKSPPGLPLAASPPGGGPVFSAASMTSDGGALVSSAGAGSAARDDDKSLGASEGSNEHETPTPTTSDTQSVNTLANTLRTQLSVFDAAATRSSMGGRRSSGGLPPARAPPRQSTAAVDLAATGMTMASLRSATLGGTLRSEFGGAPPMERRSGALPSVVYPDPSDGATIEFAAEVTGGGGAPGSPLAYEVRYSVEGVARPAFKRALLREEGRKMFFPDINKIVDLPHSDAERDAVIGELTRLFERAGVALSGAPTPNPAAAARGDGPAAPAAAAAAGGVGRLNLRSIVGGTPPPTPPPQAAAVVAVDLDAVAASVARVDRGVSNSSHGDDDDTHSAAMSSPRVHEMSPVPSSPPGSPRGDLESEAGGGLDATRLDATRSDASSSRDGGGDGNEDLYSAAPAGADPSAGGIPDDDATSYAVSVTPAGSPHAAAATGPTASERAADLLATGVWAVRHSTKDKETGNRRWVSLSPDRTTLRWFTTPDDADPRQGCPVASVLCLSYPFSTGHMLVNRHHRPPAADGYRFMLVRGLKSFEFTAADRTAFVAMLVGIQRSIDSHRTTAGLYPLDFSGHRRCRTAGRVLWALAARRWRERRRHSSSSTGDVPPAPRAGGRGRGTPKGPAAAPAPGRSKGVVPEPAAIPLAPRASERRSGSGSGTTPAAAALVAAAAQRSSTPRGRGRAAAAAPAPAPPGGVIVRQHPSALGMPGGRGRGAAVAVAAAAPPPPRGKKAVRKRF